MKKYQASLLILAVLTAGCASYPQSSTVASPPVEAPERVRNLLEEGEHLKAVSIMLNRSDEDFGDSFALALAGLEAEWDAAVQDGNWRRALAYWRSFQIIGEAAPAPQIPEQDIILIGVNDYLETGRPGAAAALLRSFLASRPNLQDSENWTPEKRQELAGLFEESGHRVTAALLRGEESPESPGLAPLVNGTVTIWVNRGIRLVGNVGIPDRGIGSGFFVGPDGYILTNYHVIESEVDPTYQGYSRLFIKIADASGERIPAKVVGWSKDFDLALLKTELAAPYVFNFSQDREPALGERISAIGSPGGLMRSLTSGTVSAADRPVLTMAGSLQIDVPINPGNSGGPLLNSRGEVVGVVFAGVAGYDGVNFAIPGRFAEQLLPQLYENGRVELPWLGASAWDRTGTMEITYVVPGSPAAEAGLRSGDILTAVDGRKFNTVRDIQEYWVGLSPATLVSLDWLRENREHTGTAVLGLRPESPLESALAKDAREHLLHPLFGFSVERISGSGIHQNYRVVSVLPGSIADDAGFTPGDTFSLRRWLHDEEYPAVAIQVVLKGRKAGFLESAVQIAAPLMVSTVF